MKKYKPKYDSEGNLLPPEGNFLEQFTPEEQILICKQYWELASKQALEAANERKHRLSDRAEYLANGGSFYQKSSYLDDPIKELDDESRVKHYSK